MFHIHIKCCSVNAGYRTCCICSPIMQCTHFKTSNNFRLFWFICLPLSSTQWMFSTAFGLFAQTILSRQVFELKSSHSHVWFTPSPDEGRMETATSNNWWWLFKDDMASSSSFDHINYLCILQNQLSRMSVVNRTGNSHPHYWKQFLTMTVFFFSFFYFAGLFSVGDDPCAGWLHWKEPFTRSAASAVSSWSFTTWMRTTRTLCCVCLSTL